MPSHAWTCTRCGHSSDEHRADDALDQDITLPGAVFRCVAEDCSCPDCTPGAFAGEHIRCESPGHLPPLSALERRPTRLP